MVLGIGIFLLFKPIIVLFSFVKIFSDILGFVAFLVAMILALVIGLTIVALAWIAHRPLIAIGMVILSVGVIVFFNFVGGKGGATASTAFIETMMSA